MKRFEKFSQSPESALKAEGWKQKKIDGKWHHFCPDCKEAK